MKKLFLVLFITLLATSAYSKPPEKSIRSLLEITYKLLTGKSEEAPSYRQILKEAHTAKKEKINSLKRELEINDLKNQEGLRARLRIELAEKQKEFGDIISVIEGYDPSILKELN